MVRALYVRAVPHACWFRWNTTALEVATREHHEDVAAFLRSAGALDGLPCNSDDA